MAAIGAGPSPTLFDAIIGVLSAIGMTSVAHDSARLAARRRALATLRPAIACRR